MNSVSRLRIAPSFIGYMHPSPAIHTYLGGDRSATDRSLSNMLPAGYEAMSTSIETTPRQVPAVGEEKSHRRNNRARIIITGLGGSCKLRWVGCSPHKV